MRPLLMACVVASLAAGLAQAAPAPRVSIAGFAQLSAPLPYPYDERADANAVVALAKARARSSHKRLLIILGANWCADCRILAAVMALPEVKAFVQAHYVSANVDVGRFDKNLQIPARYGLQGRLQGVPTLLVVDPVHDRLIDAANAAALADARHMSPQALADWLARWTS
ncbi:MAG TPA: thioredoxin family protein [Caulobacteraceae bacterium]|nr:thioredoxin family protein [Caulobacteraceae bacterium]